MLKSMGGSVNFPSLKVKQIVKCRKLQKVDCMLLFLKALQSKHFSCSFLLISNEKVDRISLFWLAAISTFLLSMLKVNNTSANHQVALFEMFCHETVQSTFK